MNHIAQKLLLLALYTPFFAAGGYTVAGGLRGSHELWAALLCGAYFIVLGGLCVQFIWRRVDRPERT